LNTTEIILEPGKLDLDAIRTAACGPVSVTLVDGTRERVQRSFDTVRHVLDSGKTVYGINTGFGLLANKRIPADQLTQLQTNLVNSHSSGVGNPIEPGVVRLAFLLKLNCLTQGFSGVSWELIETLLRLLNSDSIPWIPEKGSVGASGDLAPLAHLSQTLLGEGFFVGGGRVNGGSVNGNSNNSNHIVDKIPAREVLEQLKISPLELHPKEGLALLNGTQISTSFALKSLVDCQRVFDAAMIAGAMSVDAAMGSDAPFDARIHAVRGHAGQIHCAKIYRQLLSDSEIRASHLDCDRVQDPYSLRCQPQVMGACLDQMAHVEKILTIEANAVSDNPLVFPIEPAEAQIVSPEPQTTGGDILSGGNFHAEPVALVSDNLATAIAEIGALSERRIALLIDAHLSNLPPFLIEEGGLNSGFMIPQVTASALASENKSLAHPASVDSLPTSANQEDHVSMATFAARRLGEMLFNTANILAIELMCAAQGIDFRRPLATSPELQKYHTLVRIQSKFVKEDRCFSEEIEAIATRIVNGDFAAGIA